MVNKAYAIMIFASCVFSLKLSAQVRLPRIVRDSMVLQRDASVKIWGWASAKEKVVVFFNNKKYPTRAADNGNWSVSLPPTKAGGPYNIDIKASNSITIKDVLFGDVWFCSGQSNMVHQMNIHDVSYAKEIATANYPLIRQFWIPTLANLQQPQNDLPYGHWKAAVGEDVRSFSAVAYFFAKKLFEKYHVPIGIINASFGGAPIEAWISAEGLKGFSRQLSIIQKNKVPAYINNLKKPPIHKNSLPKQQMDAGLNGSTKWYDIAYQPKGWRSINIPGYWEDQGLKDLNGVVWYRKEIDIPPSIANKQAKLFLGRIVDADELYINGKLVGNTTYQYPQRRYTIPNGLIHTGKNIFVIRVTNSAGKGGFVPDKPYCIFTATDTIDLKGTWQYKVGDAFKPFDGDGLGNGISFYNQPTALYNAMVAPALNYTIKGFCWYQGESNTGKPQQYARLLPALINNWREKWKQPNLPFLYVQLPGYMDYNYLPGESNWALLREAQLKALSVKNTAMVVAIDLGEWNDIHPDNKKDIGERLAMAARKMAYKEDIPYSGPLYQSSTIEKNKIIVSFTHTASGLTTIDNEAPSDFAIAGADKKFVWAKAKIQDNQVVVWNAVIAKPIYVRYAWADNPVNPNFYNKEGLPASPFRTDK